MTSTTLFYIIIGIIVLKFIFDKTLNHLNAKHFKDELPEEVQDVYDDEEYKRSQEYKLTNYRFGILTSSFSLLITLLFFFFDGFEIVDNFARNYSQNAIIIALIFFGIIVIGSNILSIPFSYYKTFVIEEKFGFIFIVCATGKTAAEMLEILKQRIQNDPQDELLNAAKEQNKITKIRLEKML